MKRKKQFNKSKFNKKTYIRHPHTSSNFWKSASLFYYVYNGLVLIYRGSTWQLQLIRRFSLYSKISMKSGSINRDEM